MYKHKYKPGDIVRVRSDLAPGFFYDKVPFVASMDKFSGKELKILKYKHDGYKVYENVFTWTDDMFETFAFKMPTNNELNDFLNL